MQEGGRVVTLPCSISHFVLNSLDGNIEGKGRDEEKGDGEGEEEKNHASCSRGDGRSPEPESRFKKEQAKHMEKITNAQL